MAQFTIYTSTDDSAPSLTGEVGTLVNLLDKCLVAGYGTKAAAGWTKPFTGTNKAVFKQGTGSCGFYLRVLDDGSIATTAARIALITGYTTMSSVDAGGGQFPDSTQGILGTKAYWGIRKSDTLDSVARPWILVADSMTFYLFVNTATNGGHVCGFGDFYSLAPGITDINRCFIAGMNTEANSLASFFSCGLGTIAAAATWSNMTGITVAKGMSDLGAGLPAIMVGDGIRGGAGGAGALNGVLQSPNIPDSGFYLNPLWVGIPTGFQLRGRFRGLWQWLHPNASIGHGDVLSGTGPQVGKTFLFLKMAGTSGVHVIETSNTVETNTP